MNQSQIVTDKVVADLLSRCILGDLVFEYGRDANSSVLKTREYNAVFKYEKTYKNVSLEINQEKVNFRSDLDAQNIGLAFLVFIRNKRLDPDVLDRASYAMFQDFLAYMLKEHQLLANLTIENIVCDALKKDSLRGLETLFSFILNVVKLTGVIPDVNTARMKECASRHNDYERMNRYNLFTSEVAAVAYLRSACGKPHKLH